MPPITQPVGECCDAAGFGEVIAHTPAPGEQLDAATFRVASAIAAEDSARLAATLASLPDGRQEGSSFTLPGNCGDPCEPPGDLTDGDSGEWRAVDLWSDAAAYMRAIAADVRARLRGK